MNFFVSVSAIVLLSLRSAFSSPLYRLSGRTDSGKVRLVQYVQTFRDPANPEGRLSLLPLLSEQTSVTHVILAALHVNQTPGDITLNDDPPSAPMYDSVWSDVKTLQQGGVKVLMMVGGAAQGTYGRLCRSGDGGVDDTYYSALREFSTTFDIDGFDLDIEEPVTLACAKNLVRRLKSDMGDGFIVTMAPVASDLTPTMRGLSGFSYKALETSEVGALVDWYNTQYYSGFVEESVEDSYAAAIANGFSASKIVTGFLDSSDNGFGFLSLSDLKGALANLRSSNTAFAGADGWEYFNAGNSDGLTDRNAWLRAIGQAISGRAGVAMADVRRKHTPPMSEEMRRLMREGYGQIEAAVAIRYAARGRSRV